MRYYLDKINKRPCCHNVENDGRRDKWKKERKKYGFDERDTWCLYGTMTDLLYERVKMYVDVCCIDLEFHEFEMDGKLYTQKELIDLLLSKCEQSFSEDSFEKYDKLNDDIWKIWHKLSKSMWW